MKGSSRWSQVWGQVTGGHHHPEEAIVVGLLSALPPSSLCSSTCVQTAATASLLTLSPSLLPSLPLRLSPASSHPHPHPRGRQPFCTASPVRLSGAVGTMDFRGFSPFPGPRRNWGQLLKTLFFGAGTTSPNKGIFYGCWEGDNCFHLANICCQPQCFLLEANVWLRRQCQAKYFLCIKIPLIF